ncbi:M14 family metallopeptidase [Brevibacillus choshinensis]|uniref:Zinc carboxypeptidase n=1 Tax=Brevibacillus choshinensis TaxID=54911 RepID=A0ABX7FWQ7_BRECH|nr:M14 family metallopeptidase [Brevibacillus choshinensis]QRG70086.1 zinc carboxypeptidase [Brevibacillus choshinensis]
MHTSMIWSNEGIFFSLNGKAAPKGIRNRMTVPSAASSWESAAMVELAGRLGLHLPDLPLPVFENLFVADVLDPHSHESLPKGHRPFHLVLGYDWKWLESVVGERIQPLQTFRQGNQQESGILHVIEKEEETILVVTGTSPQMTLHAARTLVSERFEQRTLEEATPMLIPADGLPPAAAANPETKPTKRYSLHNLFTTDGIFQKKEGELLPTLDVHLAVANAEHEQTVAFVELAARLAQAAGYVCFPMTLTNEEEAAQKRFVIEFVADGEDESNPPCLQLDDQHHALKLTSPSGKLVPFIREFLHEGLKPLDSWQEDTWRHRFANLTGSSPDVSVRARLGLQAFSQNETEALQSLQVPEHLSQPIELWHNYVGHDVAIQIEAEEPIWTAKWDDPGELEEMKSYLLEQWKRMPAGPHAVSSLEIEVTTTASEQTFWEWAAQLQPHFLEQWGVSVRFVYRDANKSGLNWAMQEVLPAIKQLTGIRHIQVRARSFQSSEKHLDLVHRYLQELYPFDSILARELGLPLEQISLSLGNDADSPMFEVVAFDQEGRELEAWSWEGWVESLPYMPGQPKRGHVMVPFAGVRMYEGATGSELASQSFPTNPYRFWKWYQGHVLPQVLGQVGDLAGVPKFSRLECHVGMDAVEKKVPHLEENSSVLEALHEDIYFYTLHAMHDHGKKVGDPEWDAPGGILPFMHVQRGVKPWASVSLYAFPSDHRVSIVYRGGGVEILTPHDQAYFRTARVTGMTAAETEWTFAFQGIEGALLEEQCGNWLAAAASEPSLIQRVAEGHGKKSIWEDVFVNEDVQQWLESRMNQIPGNVTPLDYSLNGRWIWMTELFSSGTRSTLSARSEKHGLYKPTFFINARHHANEVSSTNAALQLIEKIADDPEVLESLNLVIIPLENTDGAALHAEMAKENPCWKHHAARYNACGLEFAKYRFQDGVSFGESRVYPKVWERWAPDIVLDDHGIPSHEWIQPFSGYNSPPRFPVSYWIPSARMYTIWRELIEASAVQREAYQSIRSHLTKRLDEDPQVAADNKDWLQTYRRWGNDFDPVHFPIELSNGSIAYTRDSPINRTSHDLIERFPEWVTADLMTEVNDETVYGVELAACRHAHHVVHQAIVDWMKDRPIQVQVSQQHMESGKTRIGLERSRPL